MSSNINILKWLFALVLIFGGFTVYKIFGVLATDLGDKEYVWLLKIIAEFGLFTSVVISVGFFHHWIIATEERKETEKIFHSILTKYIDGTVINAKMRGFVGITEKELDFSEIIHSLYPGDYIYWLITFDPRYKHHSREFELAIKKGVHFRILNMLIVTVNRPLNWAAMLKTLKPHGRLHVVGAVLEPMQISVFDLMFGQKSVSASPTGGPSAISTMLDFAARHHIAPQVEHFPMSKVNDALEHLATGKARYRIVLDTDFV